MTDALVVAAQFSGDDREEAGGARGGREEDEDFLDD
jgi:hypothetical protein